MTVYEKRGSNQLYVEWWDDLGRHQKAIGALIGEPVTDKSTAEELAVDMARAQRQRRNQAAAQTAWGFNPSRTLGELLHRLHADKWSEWRPSYQRDQKRFRAFWQDQLGESTPLVKINPAMVEHTARTAAKQNSWSPATLKRYLRYIVDAFSYAQRSLKWIVEQHNLSAVRMPRFRSESKAYSEPEIKRLLPALVEVDPRAGFVGHVAWQTGRRLNAIRLLGRDDVRVLEDGEVAVMTFPAEIDKARNKGEAVITRHAVLLLEALLEHGRHYLVSDEDGEPISKERLIREWLPAAESLAGIQHVNGRAYHGIKRRFATATAGMKARDKQSGTLATTLDREYLQDDLDPKIELAKRLDTKVSTVPVAVPGSL